jgi:hypothetical protein
LAGELELALGEGLTEPVEELAAKDPAERLDVEQEVRASGDPAAVIERQGASRDQAVEMEMVAQGLVPRVKHGEKAELPPQLGAAKFQQGLGDGLEQEVADDFLVGQRQGVQLVRESKDQMEVADRQQFSLAVFQPAGFSQALALGAMAIPTGNGELSITCLMGSTSLWGVRLYWGRAARATRPFDSPLRLGL